jgi:2,3-bisphosphoglycerate-dependent phosphoglycerate mutase
MMRHGEALDDIEDCYGGIADFPLTDKGRAQAKDVAAQLHNSKPSIIYSSPLQRANEAANIIAKELRLGGVTVIADLQERNSYGVLSGVNKDKAKQIFANIFANLREPPGYSREPIPGCEPFDEFLVRVRSAFNSVILDATSRGADTIGIVTHGKFTQALFEEVLLLKDKVNLKLSALNTLDYRPAVAAFVQ